MIKKITQICKIVSVTDTHTELIHSYADKYQDQYNIDYNNVKYNKSESKKIHQVNIDWKRNNFGGWVWWEDRRQIENVCMWEREGERGAYV